MPIEPFAPKDFRVFERPVAALASLDADGWRRLGRELVRTRDGQLVLGARKRSGSTFTALERRSA
jgi:hypothetical protein